jgi:hypothetical protein
MLLSARKLCTLLLGVALVAQAGATAAFGQASATAGGIRGTVVDQQGALIGGATVTARNLDTGLTREATTEESGLFRFSTLPVGNYEVTINAQGFGQLKRSGIVIRVGDEVDLKLELSASGATEVVNVTAEAPIADPGKTQVSTTINDKAIQELPINGRRWSNFVTLTPGVTPDGNFGLISFRGISGLLNNNTIDGADNNQAFFSEERGRTRINYVVGQESIKEFQVNTQNYSPEFGRAAGGVVNAVTKSGTNQIRGSAFYYLRDDAFNARNPLDFTSVRRPDGTIGREAVKPDDRRQQFGGTIGGPIKTDTAFWFFSYDQQKRNFPLNAQPSTPTFFLDCVDGGSTGVPAGACQQAINFILPQTGVYSRSGDQWIFLPKFDWQVAKDHLFSASYNYMKWNSPNGIQTQPVVNTAESNNGADKVRVDIVNLRLTSTLSATHLNEFRFQYGRDFESQIPNAPDSVGLNIGSGGPGNSGTGFNMGIAEFLPRAKFPDEKKYQFVDNYSIYHGNHSLKFGADLVKSKDDIDNLRFGAGYYNYGFRNNRQGIQNFAIDLATPGARNYTNYTQAFGLAQDSFSTWDINLFVQDEWKIKPNVTLNYGFRYEYIKMPGTILANPLVPETAEIPEDKNNFGPRVGVAWDLFNDRKTVIRAGWGIYYGRIINSAIFNGRTVTGAQGASFNLNFTAANGPVHPATFDSVPTGGTTPRPSIFYFEPNIDAPEIRQADLAIEREITPSLSVSASYLYSRGSNLPFFFDANLPLPNRTQTFAILSSPTSTTIAQTITLPIFIGGAAARPNQSFDRIIVQRGAVKSYYDAVVFQINKRLSRGIQLLAHYTLAKAEDLNQGSVTFTSSFPTAFNPFDLEAERGRSNFDVKNRFVASFIWEMPFARTSESPFLKHVAAGWKLNGIVNLQDGARVTGSVGGNLPSFRDPDGTQIASISGSPNGSGGLNRVPFEERNLFRRPSLQNIDLRLGKEFRVKERYRINFIAEAFNIFNRTHWFGATTTRYDLITITAGLPAGTALPAFRPRTDFLTLNSAQSTLYRERQMQLALKFNF